MPLHKMERNIGDRNRTGTDIMEREGKKIEDINLKNNLNCFI